MTLEIQVYSILSKLMYYRTSHRYTTPLAAKQLKLELSKYINPEKAAFFPKFFKTGKGEYSEGDKFIGITVPDQRKVAGEFKDISLLELQKVIESEVHEHRLTASIIVVNKFRKTNDMNERKKLIDFYLQNLDYVNNWDLVDTSAEILGEYLADKDRKLIYELANSDKLWHQRISIIATFHYIKHHQFSDTLAIAEMLLTHEHDLIQKAVGWMLRELGKRDLETEIQFLDKHYRKMPRTMLRYAIERFPEDLRQKYPSRESI